MLPQRKVKAVKFMLHVFNSPLLHFINNTVNVAGELCNKPVAVFFNFVLYFVDKVLFKTVSKQRHGY